MPNPGISDPYWFEWYVGLKYIIEMLNPDSGISCVIFQHETYQTIDDIVVEYDNGTSQLCYQVKHEIATSQPDNLTFGKLLEKGENGKCLFEALFLGWKKASSGERSTIKPVLYTNRKILDRRAGRTYNGTKYSAYPVDQFLSLMQGIFENVKDYSDIVIREPALLHQWEEFCSALRIKKENIPDAVDFLKRLTIQANQSGLVGVEQELLSALSSLFACNESLSNELLGKLVFALRKWTTTRREDARVTKEEVFSVLGTESDINESQHRLAPPFPFFKSRQAFCKIVEQKIRETDKRIVLLSGDPGSGKTSVISYLQSTSNFFLLRYHTFRPISPEQRFYDADAGICSSENLWGTLLIQLRQKLKGKLAEYEVPISNKLLTVEGMRSHVCRLLGRLAVDQNRRIYVCIDGIDHAARANANNIVSFLSSLPLSSEIPDGVCFVIVGQPIHLYQRQYPVWLSDGKLVEYLDMPKLCVEDIGQLITCKLPQFREVADGLAKFIYERTEGNNLSAVFAIEEIKGAVSPEEAMGQLRDSQISSDIQQYYHHIWNYMRKAILDMGLLVAFPESVIACSILLMNGRVDTEILSAALQHKYNVSEAEWRQILDKLYPLVVPSSKKGEYALFHNDFRIFLMGSVNECKTLYRDIALALAEYLLHTENGLLKYISAIPLLQCAERTDLVPTYFTAGFVINALAEGVSKQRLDDFLRISYAAACDNQDYEGYTNAYLAAKTLYQHESYFEYYERQYICNDYPELSLIDISEVRVLPARRETLHEYERVLTLCTKLYKADTKEYSERAAALYTNWFGKLSPYSFAGLCSEEEAPEDEAWKLRTTEIGFFLQNWGTSAAELGIVAPVLEKPASQKEFYALLTFGEAYFTKCIDLRKPDMAVTAVECGFVSKACLSKSLENMLYNGFASKFELFLPQIQFNQESPSEKLLAMVMQVICQSEPEIEKAQLTPYENVQSIYDEISFSTVLRSFLLGYAECALDDAVICGHTKEFFSFLEGDTQEKDQISRLARLAALLGKSYSKSKMSISDAFRRHVEWFLTSRLWRSIDYSKARRFLIFVLFQSPFVDSLADTEWFLSALKVQLFEIEYIGFYYKTDILGFLRRHERLDIIREYILTLYGENCGRISQEENKADMHHQFLPFGEIVEPQMMKEFSNRLKWDVVEYTGHKEYAMQGLSDAFEIISKEEPEFWREAGVHLYQQSKIAAISNNECEYEICENIVSATVNCGISDFWALHDRNDEFRMNPSLIEHALYGFVEQAKRIEDLEVLWLLNCGLHSWYTQGNRLGSKSVYESCYKRALELEVDFRNEVEKVTPQWLKIIDYESRERNYRYKENDFTKQQSEELSKICAEYEANTTDELMEILPEVPLLHHAEKRYELIIDKLVSESSFTIDNARHVLESICSFLAGKEWEYERFDTILSSLLLRLGNEAFWRLAATIGLHLCDYNYQTSTRNMRVLLKLYFRHDTDQMKALFEKELSVHEQWVTGNHHIPVEFKLDLPQRAFEVPSNLAEMALYILIEQIGTHNARKIESAVFAVYKLGKSFPNLLDTVALNWDKIPIAQKEFLLPVVTKWIFEDINSKQLSDALLKDYMSCNLLPFKYYYHSILVRLKGIGLEKDRLTFEAAANEYTLPVFGKCTKSGAYENFLSLVEHPDEATSSNDIRGYIAQFSADELSREDEYGEPEDLRIPTWNQDISNVLYGEEKSGRWNSSSLLSKKSMLIPLEDPFLLTDMPQIVYDEEWFPDVPWKSHGDVEKGGLRIEELHDVVYKNIKSSEILLAACIWYPWNYKDGCIFYELTQVKPAYDLSSNNQIDCCVGNFGLLTYEGDIEESHFACKQYDSINLFNKVRGNIKISFGNGQVVPSSAWRKIFHCEPSDESPYRWVDENGVEVLRLERIASPIREATREVYIRQPILFRWICNKEWLKQKLEELQLRVCFITSHERMPF